VEVSVKNLDKSMIFTYQVMSVMRAKWFVCFGTLLGLIRDNGVVKGDDDIDIGMYYEDLTKNGGDGYRRLVLLFKKWGYKIKHEIRPRGIIPDIPLNIHFTHKELPDLDIFAWYKYKKIRYHTYDVDHTKEVKPKEYTLKGVMAEWLDETIMMKFPFLSKQIGVPLRYGTLLDEWYPNWGVPQKGESKTRWVKKVRDFKSIV